MGEIMRWPVITGEQWIALGTMLGGIAQLCLVVVGLFAGREWLRQRRFDGVRLLLEEYVTLHHDMQKSLAQLQQLTSTGASGTFWEVRDTAVIQLNAQRIQLLLLASRSRFYSDDLADGLNALNEQLKTYQHGYDQYRQIPIGEAARALDFEDAKFYNSERKRLGLLLFVPDSDWWIGFIHSNDTVMKRGRCLLWGKNEG
jgi:hypothetical protein